MGLLSYGLYVDLAIAHVNPIPELMGTARHVSAIGWKPYILAAYAVYDQIYRALNVVQKWLPYVPLVSLVPFVPLVPLLPFISQHQYQYQYRGTGTGTRKCQYRIAISDRIVGGMDASIDQIPWMASIYVNNRGHCGATIIDERWILTAAHCLHPNVNKNDIIVRIGSNNKLSVRPLGVKEAHIHPNIKYDISYANRVCLPINAALSDRHPMLTMFSGWGQISTDGRQPTNTLMKTDYYTIPNHLCKYKSEYFICVNGSQSMGCSGDSGSPLVVYQGCNAVLMGVYSYGESYTGHTCGPKLMIFVRVAKHMPWIQQLIGNKQQSLGSGGTE
ncbi:unnamed protein product [Medioppia subpectinata]|uniref:Peptidase S1 domain-containing protein n=1 Tax=Medioppia subpectinata TaxID=1979941 RepID=A0A7R9KRN6_9ACAR|nr:unnamed protein product [Medioppia subpectinata]CAG2107372.1 unnamed protein product [Medioppia subpectinata]